MWGRKNSSNVQKVLWTCAELGVAFERVDWGGPFGGNQDSAYLALNPNGLVPTVQDGDLVIWESNTIMRWLCATRGGERLHPSDPALRTHVERWMDWNLSSLTTPMSGLLWGYYRTPPEKRDATALDAARRRAIELLAMVERRLDGRNYLAGDAFTLADIGIGIWVHRWYFYPIERPDMPRLKAWYGRIGERAGFRDYVAGPVS
ncbi:MAG TPA: glutathione S-transferase family protein [Stellaceae bacterium]